MGTTTSALASWATWRKPPSWVLVSRNSSMACAPDSGRKEASGVGTGEKVFVSCIIIATTILRRAMGSALHVGVQVRGGQRAVEVAEGALVLHLARGVDEAGHGHAIERGGEADPLHPRFRELGHRKGLALDAHHEVERLGKRATDLAYRFQIGQARRHEHVGPRLLEGLQLLDDVVQIGLAPQEAFGAGG